MWLTRYLDSYNRQKPEDALLDLIIVSEVLFGDPRGEITHKISTRATFFLMSDPSLKKSVLAEKRRKTRSELKEYYNLRFKIVHGGKIKTSLNAESFNDIILPLREYIRQIIRKLIDLDASFLSKNWNKYKMKLLTNLDIDFLEGYHQK